MKSTKSKKVKNVQVDKDMSASIYDLDYTDVRWILPDGTPFIPDTSTLSLPDYKKMLQDYQISVCINTIVFTIQQIDWDIKCDNEEIKDFCNYNLKLIWNQLMRGMKKAYWAGFSPMIKIFTIEERGKWKNKIIIKKIKDLDPNSVTVKQNKQDGTFEGIKKGEKVIDPLYCFWYTFLMSEGDYYGTKLLEPAYMPYFYSQVIHLFANRYYERFGEPVVKGLYPEGSKVQVGAVEKDAHDFMASLVKKIRNHTSITLPSTRDEEGNLEWEVNFLESNMRGADFETYLKRLDMEKARAIFVPDLLFGTGRVGSYKLGERHTNTFLTLLNSLIGDLKDHIDKYILPSLVDFNFGSQAPPAYWKPEQLGKANQDIIATVVREMIRQGMAKVNVKDIAKSIGMEVEEIEQIIGEDDVPPNNKKVVPPKKKKVIPPKKEKKKKIIKKLKKKDFFSIKYNGKELTPREQTVPFKKIEKIYNNTERQIKKDLSKIVSKQRIRVEKIIRKLYNEGKVNNLKDVKIGYRGAYEKIWKGSLLSLYIIGAEEEIKRANLKVNTLITKEERTFLDDNAASISRIQLDDLENKINLKILQVKDLKIGKAAAIAIIVPIFSDFLASNKSLSLSVGRAVVWGVRQGKIAVAERSDKTIIAKVWSAVLDDRTCDLCEHLNNSYIPYDSPDFSLMIPPVHWNCRCEEIMVYKGDAMGEGEKKYKKPSKKLIKKYGGLISNLI